MEGGYYPTVVDQDDLILERDEVNHKPEPDNSLLEMQKRRATQNDAGMGGDAANNSAVLSI